MFCVGQGRQRDQAQDINIYWQEGLRSEEELLFKMTSVV